MWGRRRGLHGRLYSGEAADHPWVSASRAAAGGDVTSVVVGSDGTAAWGPLPGLGGGEWTRSHERWVGGGSGLLVDVMSGGVARDGDGDVDKVVVVCLCHAPTHACVGC